MVSEPEDQATSSLNLDRSLDKVVELRNDGSLEIEEREESRDNGDQSEEKAGIAPTPARGSAESSPDLGK